MKFVNRTFVLKRGIKMFNKICLTIYSYRCLIGVYFFGIGLLGLCFIDLDVALESFKPQTIIPFLEVIAYQLK